MPSSENFPEWLIKAFWGPFCICAKWHSQYINICNIQFKSSWKMRQQLCVFININCSFFFSSVCWHFLSLQTNVQKKTKRNYKILMTNHTKAIYHRTFCIDSGPVRVIFQVTELLPFVNKHVDKRACDSFKSLRKPPVELYKFNWTDGNFVGVCVIYYTLKCARTCFFFLLLFMHKQLNVIFLFLFSPFKLSCIHPTY